MKRALRQPSIAAVALTAALTAASCGEGPPIALADKAQAASGSLSVRIDKTGIFDFVFNGQNLGATYYVIGSCTGADDPGQNVVSLGGDGNTLHAPGSCPGAPFSIAVSGNNPFVITVSVGPLPADYNTLSVPLDPNKQIFDRFSFAGSAYKVGCSNTLTPVAGSGGTFASIPQPCYIPGHGPVGVAEVRPAPAWGQISGNGVAIRRTLISGDATVLSFHHHPYTHNIEPGFSKLPFGSSPLKQGSLLTLVERLEVFDPGAVPPEVDEAQLVSASLPDRGMPGAWVPVTIVMRNTGTTTWIEPSSHQGGTRLGTLGHNAIDWVWGPAGGYANHPGDQRLFLGSAVAPGQQASFDFQLQLPRQPGTHSFAARMVHDGVTWFGPTIETAVVVAEETVVPADASPALPDASGPLPDASGPPFDGTSSVADAGSLASPDAGPPSGDGSWDATDAAGDDRRHGESPAPGDGKAGATDRRPVEGWCAMTAPTTVDGLALALFGLLVLVRRGGRPTAPRIAPFRSGPWSRAIR